jgi:NAD(P)-dependent dehydrogenase (short-subunit alcohol dehydrogenase family)
LVTGGNRGLGFAIARNLGEEGYTVLLACRDKESGRMAAEELRGQGHDVRFVPLDVARGADTARLRAMFESSPALVPHLIFNNAAVCLPGSSAETLRRTFAVNFFGAMRIQAALLPLMAAAAGADAHSDAVRSIVHVSSGDGELCLLGSRLQRALAAAESVPAVAALLRATAAGAARRAAAGAAAADDDDELAVGPTPAYSLSKAAVNAATRICGGAGGAGSAGRVRIVAVCPGDVDTAMLDGAPAGPVLPPAAAAADVVWAARAPPSACLSGGFYRARAPIPW